MSETEKTQKTELPSEIPAETKTEEVEQISLEKNETKPAEENSNLSKLTPKIIEALTFDNSIDDILQLREKNSELQMLLRTLLEILKNKMRLGSQIEKQNLALNVQINALKDVVGFTKDLLSIRNMEVQHLQTDMKAMEEKIAAERLRHNAMLEKMSVASKLSQNLKNEYQTQLGLFQDLREKYDEKVTILTNENKRLQELNNEEPCTEEETEVACLETIPPR